MLKKGCIALVMLALALAGCGKTTPGAPASEKPGSTAKSSGTAAGTEKTAGSQQAASQKPAKTGTSTPVEKTVRVLCGSSMSVPIQDLANEFEKKTGIHIELTLGGCETLFPQLELGAPADIFVGHSPFQDMLKKKNLRQDRLVLLGEIGPAIMVPKGNPKHITSIKDLTRDDVRVGLPDARYSTCGEFFEKTAKSLGLLDAIHKRTVYSSRTHQELATNLLSGSVDVVVVWNFIAAMHKDKVEVVPVATRFASAQVFATLVSNPQHPDAARQFLDYLDRDASKQHFADLGYRLSTSQPASPKGEKSAALSSPVTLRYYCAAALQKPMQELTSMFRKQRPNVDFEMVYQGSGTLLAQIALKKEGDLYSAGDEVYMEQAAQKKLLLHAAQPVVMFTPVLAVPRDNAKNIQSVADLEKSGVRLGLGDEQAAAIGKVSRAWLTRLGAWPAIKKNVVLTAGTVTELAVQLSVHALDAAVIWNATANQFANKVRVVQRGDSQSRIGAPIGVLRFSRYPNLAQAFVDFVTSPAAAPVLRKHGFTPAVS